MGKVSFNMSVSLDGYVAGPNGEVDRLFAWYFSGDQPFPFPGSPYTFMVSRTSLGVLEEAVRSIGAIITGRRNFDGTQGWGGNPPLGVHHFVVTHRPPQEWVMEDWPFTFVTAGVESAIRQAKAYAGEKDVVISTPSIMQQALALGLLDEITIDLAPVLLGDGLRLFEKSDEPVSLECTSVIEAPSVTHLRYRVVK